MPQTTEYTDKKGQHRIRHKADNGKITYASSQGYQNKTDMLDAAVNASLELLKNYLSDMNQEQLQELVILGEEAKNKF